MPLLLLLLRLVLKLALTEVDWAKISQSDNLLGALEGRAPYQTAIKIGRPPELIWNCKSIAFSARFLEGAAFRSLVWRAAS